MRYFQEPDYWRITDTLRVFTGIVLLGLAKNSSEMRDKIVSGFLARGMVSLLGVHHLWNLKHYEDCWVLYRVILDRFLHLRWLGENNSFEIFEKLSFIEQYEARSNLCSDPEFRTKADPQDLVLDEAQKERYRELKKEKLPHIRVRPEDVAKGMDMHFIYRYGYDYASSFVHPQASDGQDCIRQLTGQERGLLGDQAVVLHNAILVQTMLIQEGMNQSTVHWISLMYKFLEQCRNALEKSSLDFITTMFQIVAQGPHFDFCKKSDKS